MENKILIVTSHFNEDLDWLKNQEKYDYLIYSKNENNTPNIENNKIRKCINKGNESSSYLTYIIENYDNLPDYVAFIHGHLNAYHQSDNILNLIDNFIECDYQTLNRKDWLNVLSKDSEEEFKRYNFEFVIENYDYLGLNLPKPNKLVSTACAQFIVSKKSILNNSLNVYKNMLNWLENTDLSNEISGRVFEHLWCYIFTHNEVENECV